MSWDVMIISSKEAPEALTLDYVASDWQLESMGDPNFVRQAISAALPDVDWSDSSYGAFYGEGFRLYFSVQEKSSIDLMVWNIRGNGDPIPAIFHLCEQNGWAAYDMNCNRMVTIEQAGDDWQNWTAYRDRTTKKG